MNLKHLIPIFVAAVFFVGAAYKSNIPEDIARAASAAANCKALPRCIGAISAVVVCDGSLN
jgi:hypothetical protein